MKQIILASGSPRRFELLTLAGLSLEVIIPEIEETKKRGETPKKMVSRLALEKAMTIAMDNAGKIVIAADTIVVTPDGKKFLGKPRDKIEAKKMLKSLFGKTHLVYTGYAILEWNGKKLNKSIRVVGTKVKMASLGQDAINWYLSKNESMDKAGSYAAQGIGANFIESISGSYTNVVGLPMAEILSDLKENHGVSIWI